MSPLRLHVMIQAARVRDDRLLSAGTKREKQEIRKWDSQVPWYPSIYSKHVSMCNRPEIGRARVAPSSYVLCMPRTKIRDKWAQPLIPPALSGIQKLGLVGFAGGMEGGPVPLSWLAS